MPSRGWKGCLAALALLGAFGSAGCGGQAGIAGSKYQDPNPLPPDTMVFRMIEPGSYGGRFVIGQTAGPKTFNAIMANETSSGDIDDRMFIGLNDYDNVTQQDTPMLARSTDVSPDGLTYTFHLRRGAAFSDGHPITAEDVLFSLEVCYDEKVHPSIQDLIKIDGKKFEISAPDSYTVVMKISSPYALMIPATGSVRIMPKHMLEGAFRKGQFESAYNTATNPDSVVTSGPWRIKQYVANEKTVLSRNPYWFGVDAKGQRLPYLDELVYVIVPDQTTLNLKFESGDVDGVDNVKPEDYKRYADNQQKGNYTLYDLGPSLNTNFFWFNLNRVREAKSGKKVGQTYADPVKYAWFSNPTFRRAVSMAVDRDALIRSVLFGEAVKNWSTSTPANKQWYTPEATGADYNPEEAKKLLASLGYKDKDGDGVLEDEKGHPISFSMKTNGDNVLRMQMCNFIKDDLAKVGIKCIPTGVDFNTLIVNLREDFQYDAILLGLQSAVPPDPGMGQNVYKSSGATHYWNIKQPKPETAAEAQIDQLVNANVKTIDVAERKRTWAEIQKLVNGESFVIWLPSTKVKIPIRNGFGNLEPSVIPHRILWNIDRVYRKPGAKPA